MLRLKKSSHNCGASGIVLLQQAQGSGDATKEADPWADSGHLTLSGLMQQWLQADRYRLFPSVGEARCLVSYPALVHPQNFSWRESGKWNPSNTIPSFPAPIYFIREEMTRHLTKWGGLRQEFWDHTPLAFMTLFFQYVRAQHNSVHRVTHLSRDICVRTSSISSVFITSSPDDSSWYLRSLTRLHLWVPSQYLILNNTFFTPTEVSLSLVYHVLSSLWNCPLSILFLVFFTCPKDSILLFLSFNILPLLQT